MLIMFPIAMCMCLYGVFQAQEPREVLYWTLAGAFFLVLAMTLIEPKPVVREYKLSVGGYELPAVRVETSKGDK